MEEYGRKLGGTMSRVAMDVVGKILRTIGLIWCSVVLAIIIYGHSYLWYYYELSELREVTSPFSWANYAAMVAAIVPGALVIWLGNSFRSKSKPDLSQTIHTQTPSSRDDHNEIIAAFARTMRKYPIPGLKDTKLLPYPKMTIRAELMKALVDETIDKEKDLFKHALLVLAEYQENVDVEPLSHLTPSVAGDLYANISNEEWSALVEKVTSPGEESKSKFDAVQELYNKEIERINRAILVLDRQT